MDSCRRKTTKIILCGLVCLLAVSFAKIGAWASDSNPDLTSDSNSQNMPQSGKSFKPNSSTVKVEETGSEDPADYKNATKYAQSSNANIKTLAEKLTAGKTTDREKAQAIFDYVSKNYAYKYYYKTAAGAEEMLGKKEGNGPDQAHLFVALCRAVGISARYKHVLADNAKGMGGGIPDQVERVYAQVYVDGKWMDADPADKRNDKIGELTIKVKNTIATYNEYNHKNDTNVKLGEKTKLTSAEITSYNRFQTVVNQNGVLTWPAQAQTDVMTPLTFVEVKDYFKYQDAEKIGDNYYWLADQVSKDPLTDAQVEEYKKYQEVKLGADGWPIWDVHRIPENPAQRLTLDECKEYIKYNAVVKSGDKYYWSQDAVPSADSGNPAAADTRADPTEPESTPLPAEVQKYLAATASAPSNNATIKAKAAEITAGKTSAYDKAVAIFNWVRDNLSYSFYYDSKKGALGALSSRSANCCDTSNLLVALMRAEGIPARYMHTSGAQFSDGVFGHNWAQVYANGKWYDCDAIANYNSFGTIKNWHGGSNDGPYVNLGY